MTGSMLPTGYPPANTYASTWKASGTITDDDMRAAAWHYYGYPAFSGWMASSSDFFILRRFSRTTARCLLYQQHEIARREKELDAWDELARGADADGSYASDKIEGDRVQERNQLIEELIPRLKHYHESLNSFAEVKSKPTAREHHIQNLERWFVNHPKAIHRSEQHFRDGEGNFLEGDLCPIVSKDRSPLRKFLSEWRWLRFCFRLKERSDRVESDQTTYTSETGFDRFTNTLILALGLGLLFGPMWWLNFVEDSIHRLAIITTFITVFTAVVWSAAGQRPFEILAATAAYAAVLMVFLQSNGNSSSSGGGGIAVKVH